jgi:hypothetical protein
MPTNPWVGGVLLVVTDHIKVRLGEGYTPNPNPRVGGVPLVWLTIFRVRLG